MARTWSAVLARIGTPTGDKRIIAPGALTTRDLPLPLMWQRVSGSGHGGAVTVGAIETLTIDNESGMVTATGSWLPVRGSQDAQRQAEVGVTGPSVDLFDDVDIMEVQTLVEAGVVGPNVLDNMDDIEYAMDDDGMIIITRARIAGATLVQIPAFAGVSIDMAEPTAGEGAMIGKSLLASAAPILPPLDWFRQPDLDRLTPLTISDTGRVFGHIAGWETCHVGLPGCVTPPSSVSGYSYFHVAEQATQEGPVLPVGTLVAGPRHADPQMAFQAAQSHYDVPGAAVARVMAGEDEYGIWVAGWMLPGATPQAVDIFRTSPVSGDWRRIGGALEMIAVCSVNAPGFPVPRARVAFSAGHQRTLIGSFGITPVAAHVHVLGNPDGEQPMDDWDNCRDPECPGPGVSTVFRSGDPVRAAQARWQWAQTETGAF